MALSSATPCRCALAMRDVAGAVGGEQPGTPSIESGRNDQRVEEIVVDAPVDDVDPLRARGGAHVEHVVVDEQVLPLDQLDAHLLGEEGVLEVGAVVGARRSAAPRSGRRRRWARRCAGCRAARPGSARPARTRCAAKKLGNSAHHHLAVLEHVGDARGHAQVVLEHAEFAGVVAHHVDAGDVRVDAARAHPRPASRGRYCELHEDLLGGIDAGLENLLLVVDVVDEGVERAHALLQARLEPQPIPPAAGRAARCRRGSAARRPLPGRTRRR